MFIHLPNWTGEPYLNASAPCANAEDKNNEEVQRALQVELRHVSSMHAAECEEILKAAACVTCGAAPIHIMHIPLPVLNMPFATLGVTVTTVCGNPECAADIRGLATNIMEDMREIFSGMFGQRQHPPPPDHRGYR